MIQGKGHEPRNAGASCSQKGHENRSYPPQSLQKKPTPQNLETDFSLLTSRSVKASACAVLNHQVCSNSSQQQEELHIDFGFREALDLLLVKSAQELKILVFLRFRHITCPLYPAFF